MIHAHDRGVLYDLRRHYVDQRVLLDLFGPALSSPPRSLPLNVLRSSASLCRRLYKDGGVQSVVPGAPSAVKYAVLSRIGACLGVVGHRLDRKRPRLSEALDLLLAGAKR